jgi:hypothetical protein
MKSVAMRESERILARYDNGATVALVAYSAPQHRAGAWGLLTLRFQDPAGASTLRTYRLERGSAPVAGVLWP